MRKRKYVGISQKCKIHFFNQLLNRNWVLSYLCSIMFNTGLYFLNLRFKYHQGFDKPGSKVCSVIKQFLNCKDKITFSITARKKKTTSNSNVTKNKMKILLVAQKSKQIRCYPIFHFSLLLSLLIFFATFVQFLCFFP